MYVWRAVQLVVVGIMFWAVLYLGGKVAGPDQGRLERIGQAVHDLVIGVTETAEEVASSFRGPPADPEQGVRQQP